MKKHLRILFSTLVLSLTVLLMVGFISNNKVKAQLPDGNVGVDLTTLTVSTANKGVDYEAQSANAATVGITRLDSGRAATEYTATMDCLSLESLSQTNVAEANQGWGVVTLSGFDATKLADISSYNSLVMDIEVPMTDFCAAFQLYAKIDGAWVALHTGASWSASVGTDFSKTFFRYNEATGKVSEAPRRAWLHTGSFIVANRMTTAASAITKGSFKGKYILLFESFAGKDFSKLTELKFLFANANEKYLTLNIGDIYLANFATPTKPAATDPGIEFDYVEGTTFTKIDTIWDATNATTEGISNVYTPLREDTYGVTKIASGAKYYTHKWAWDTTKDRKDNYVQITGTAPQAALNSDGNVDIKNPGVGYMGIAFKVKNNSATQNAEFILQVKDADDKNSRAGQTVSPVYDTTTLASINKGSGKIILSTTDNYQIRDNGSTALKSPIGTIPKGFDGWVYIPFDSSVFFGTTVLSTTTIKPNFTIFVNLVNLVLNEKVELDISDVQFVAIPKVEEAPADNVAIDLSTLTASTSNAGVTYTSTEANSATVGITRLDSGRVSTEVTATMDCLSLESLAQANVAEANQGWGVVTLSGFDATKLADVSSYNSLVMDIEVPMPDFSAGFQLYAKIDGAWVALHTGASWSASVGTDYSKTFFRYDEATGKVSEAPRRAWLHTGSFIGANRTTTAASAMVKSAFKGKYILLFESFPGKDFSKLTELKFLFANANEKYLTLNIGDIYLAKFATPAYPAATDPGCEFNYVEGTTFTKIDTIWDATNATTEGTSNIYEPLREDTYAVTKMASGTTYYTHKWAWDTTKDRKDNYVQITGTAPEGAKNSEGYVDVKTIGSGFKGIAFKVKNNSDTQDAEFILQVKDASGNNSRAGQTVGPVYDTTTLTSINKGTGKIILTSNEMYGTLPTLDGSVYESPVGTIPKGFDGWVYIPFDSTVFFGTTALNTDVIYPNFTIYVNLVNLVLNETVTLDISNAQLVAIPKIVVTPTLSVTKEYDGTTAVDKTANAITLSGLQEGAQVTATYDAVFESADAADEVVVHVSNVALTGDDADKYVLSKTSFDAVGTITKKEVTVTADAVMKNQYEDDPELTYKVTGLLGDDKLTGSLARAEGEEPGQYKISLGTLTAPANYTIKYVENNFTIAGVELIIYPSLVADISKVYDGTTTIDKTNLTLTLSGMRTEKPVTATFDIAFASANAGDNVTIHVTNITLQGEHASEYTLNATSFDITGNISKKDITVTADAKTMYYLHNEPALTYTVTGLVGDDTLTGELTRQEGNEVGEYSILVGTLAASSNYNMTFVGAKFTIEEVVLKTISFETLKELSNYVYINLEISSEFTRIHYNNIAENLYTECDLSNYPVIVDGANAILIRLVHTRPSTSVAGNMSDQPINIRFIDAEGHIWGLKNYSANTKVIFGANETGVMELNTRGGAIRTLRDFADCTVIIPVNQLVCLDDEEHPYERTMSANIVKVITWQYPAFDATYEYAPAFVEFAVANFGSLFYDEADEDVELKLAKANGVIPKDLWSVSQRTVDAKDEEGKSLSEYVLIDNLDYYNVTYTVNDSTMGSVRLSSDKIYRPFYTQIVFSVSPNNGYIVDKVVINGEEVQFPQNGGTYTIQPMAGKTEVTDSDIEIVVEFKSSTPDTPDNPVTQAPTTQAPTTQAPKTQTEPSETGKKKGCKGEVVTSILGISLILGSIAIVRRKRREE